MEHCLGPWCVGIESRENTSLHTEEKRREELEKKAVVDHTSVEVVPTADAHRTAIVHWLTVDVPFDQISLFELQRRRVMTRQGALVKRTRKKTKLGERIRRGARSNLRTYVSYAFDACAFLAISHMQLASQVSSRAVVCQSQPLS